MGTSFSWIKINAIIWTIWGFYWLIRYADVNRNKSVESFYSRALHLIPTVLVFFGFFSDVLNFSFFAIRILPDNNLIGITGNIFTVLSACFAVWARIELGRFWSASITLKEGHRLIRSGPYHYARHPIYTGLIFGLLGTALIIGKVFGFILVILTLGVYIRKIRNEETLMTAQFGNEYLNFKKETKAIIPYLL